MMIRFILALCCCLGLAQKALGNMSADRAEFIHHKLGSGLNKGEAEAAAGIFFKKVDAIKRMHLRLLKLSQPSYKVDPDTVELPESADMGDVHIVEEQVDELLDEVTKNFHRKLNGGDPKHKRAILDFTWFPGNRWTMPIPYAIASNVNTLMAQAVTDSVAHITSKVPCITFKKVADCSKEPGGYCITFYTHDPFKTQCRADSPVGRVVNSPIRMGICPNADSAKYVLIHEICHNLGMPHTQSRPDRDAYVTVLFDNIDPAAVSNYDKEESSRVTTYSMPYDYKSIMHYAPNTFAKSPSDPKKPTMTTKVPAMQTVIGTVKVLSDGDIAILKKAYCEAAPPAKCRLEDGSIIDVGAIKVKGSFWYTCAVQSYGGTGLSLSGCVGNGKNLQSGDKFNDGTFVMQCTVTATGAGINPAGCMGRSATGAAVEVALNGEWVDGNFYKKCSSSSSGIRITSPACFYKDTTTQARVDPGCVKKVGSAVVICQGDATNGANGVKWLTPSPSTVEATITQIVSQGYKRC